MTLTYSPLQLFLNGVLRHIAINVHRAFNSIGLAWEDYDAQTRIAVRLRWAEVALPTQKSRH